MPNKIAEIDLKDGHALPATKLAGGVRVKPHKHHSNGEKQRTNSESSDPDESNSTKQTEPKPIHPIVSGAQTKGDADFQPQAIKAYHEKPQKFSNDLMNGAKKQVIQQPKKF